MCNSAVRWLFRAWLSTLLLLAISAASPSRIRAGSMHDLLPESRIVGGNIAAKGAAPYQVSIQTIYGSHICGGAIIDKQWIVTAAHCAEDYSLEVLRIIVGTNNWREPGATHRPELAISHCHKDKPFYHNDIAVMRLDRPIEFNEFTQKIEMGQETLQPGDNVTMTGWGSLALNGEPPAELRTISLTYISKADCLSAWESDEGVGIGHICTFTKRGEGACNGDSGGPVVHDGKLVGLVNWGRPCAIGRPDMHANVVYYRDFIERSMAQCETWKG